MWDTLSWWVYLAGQFQDTTFHDSTLDAEGWDHNEQGEQARTQDHTQGRLWIPLYLHLCLLIFSLSFLNAFCPRLQMLIPFNCTLSSNNLCLAHFLMYALLPPPLLWNMFLL